MNRIIPSSILFIGIHLASLSAFGAPLAELTGKWRAAETQEESSARKAALERAVKVFPPLARGPAKDELEKRTSPSPILELAIEGQQVRITRHGRTVELELGGAPKEVEGDGRKVRVTAREDAGRLVVVNEGDNGKTTTIYELVDGGHLSVQGRIDGGRLKGPVEFKQTYDRAS